MKKKAAIIISVVVVLFILWSMGQGTKEQIRKEATTTEATTEVTTEEPTTEEITTEEIEEVPKAISVEASISTLTNAKVDAINSLGEDYNSYVSNYKNIIAWYDLVDEETEILYAYLEEESIQHFVDMVNQWTGEEFNDEWETEMESYSEQRNAKMEKMFSFLDEGMEDILEAMEQHLMLGLEADCFGVEDKYSEHIVEYTEAYGAASEKYIFYLEKFTREDTAILLGLVEGNRDVIALVKAVQDEIEAEVLAREEAAAEAAAAEDATNSTTEATASAAGQNTDVTPSFKNTMDQYESFFNEYVRFVNNYDPMDVNAATKYMNLLSKYDSTMNSLNNLDTSNLSAADYAYYYEVMGRINQKLASIAY